MSQESNLENMNEGLNGSSVHKQEFSQADVTPEDPKDIKKLISNLKQEIEDIKEANTKIASAHSYGIEDEDIADQHIVELSKQSLEEKEKELYELKQKNKQKNLKNTKKLLSAITSFFHI